MKISPTPSQSAGGASNKEQLLAGLMASLKLLLVALSLVVLFFVLFIKAIVFFRSQCEVIMKKRYRQQQTVESDRAAYPYPRSQLQEVGSVRLSQLHDHNMEHIPSVYFHRPDLYGNYAQPIDADGYQTSMILPGNAGESVTTSGISPQFLRDWLNAQRMVEGEVEEEILQIEGPEQVDPRTVVAATLDEDLQANALEPGMAARLGYRIVLDEFSGGARLEPIDDPDDASIFVLERGFCLLSEKRRENLM